MFMLKEVNPNQKERNVDLKALLLLSKDSAKLGWADAHINSFHTCLLLPVSQWSLEAVVSEYQLYTVQHQLVFPPPQSIMQRSHFGKPHWNGPTVVQSLQIHPGDPVYKAGCSRVHTAASLGGQPARTGPGTLRTQQSSSEGKRPLYRLEAVPCPVVWKDKLLLSKGTACPGLRGKSSTKPNPPWHLSYESHQ